MREFYLGNSVLLDLLSFVMNESGNPHHWGDQKVYRELLLKNGVKAKDLDSYLTQKAMSNAKRYMMPHFTLTEPKSFTLEWREDTPKRKRRKKTGTT